MQAKREFMEEEKRFKESLQRTTTTTITTTTKSETLSETLKLSMNGKDNDPNGTDLCA